MSNRVDRLIERVLCPRAGAFRPEVSFRSGRERDPAYRFRPRIASRPNGRFAARLRGLGESRRVGKAFPEVEGQFSTSELCEFYLMFC